MQPTERSGHQLQPFLPEYATENQIYTLHLRITNVLIKLMLKATPYALEICKKTVRLINSDLKLYGKPSQLT